MGAIRGRERGGGPRKARERLVKRENKGAKTNPIMDPPERE